MQASYRFRFARAEDAKSITAFVNETYHGKEAPLGWTPEVHLHAGPRTTEGAIAAHIADPDSRLLLCEGPEGMIGCILIENNAGEGHLGMFAVHPRSQAGGWGKIILAEAERVAVELWNCRTMAMSVINLQDRLIAYYERRGYRRTGERAPFPFDEAPGALRRDYDLVIVRKTLSENDRRTAT